jgi:nicotinamide mononucleotide adenylyltransferase
LSLNNTGIISPVHDAYGKKGLVPQTHRLAMLKHALDSSEWIRLSDWECRQNEWTRTRNTLQFHQNYLNSVVRDIENFNESNLPSWIPQSVKDIKEPIQIKLLCGADLLESFATPDLWDPDDVIF